MHRRARTSAVRDDVGVFLVVRVQVGVLAQATALVAGHGASHAPGHGAGWWPAACGADALLHLLLQLVLVVVAA